LEGLGKENVGTFYAHLENILRPCGILWPFGSLAVIWYILAMEDVALICVHLVYFVAVWYILWPFSIFCGRLVYLVAIWYTYFMVIYYTFSPFWYMYCATKIWQPWPLTHRSFRLQE
jgi:hypothetical protein